VAQPVDATTLISGLLTATRRRNQSVARGFRAALEDTLANRPELVSPLDEVRARLAFAEDHLYRAEPDRAAEILNALEADTRLSRLATQQPDFYVLRAAALGQQYRTLRGGGDQAAKDRLAAAAVEAIRFAHAAGQGDWLRYLATDKTDDDLGALASDRGEVQELLGLRR
jgi:hypothetical protein